LPGAAAVGAGNAGFVQQAGARSAQHAHVFDDVLRVLREIGEIQFDVRQSAGLVGVIDTARALVGDTRAGKPAVVAGAKLRNGAGRAVQRRDGGVVVDATAGRVDAAARTEAAALYLREVIPDVPLGTAQRGVAAHRGYLLAARV